MLARDASGAAVGLARVYADDGDVDMGEITATTSSGTDARMMSAIIPSSSSPHHVDTGWPVVPLDS